MNSQLSLLLLVLKLQYLLWTVLNIQYLTVCLNLNGIFVNTYKTCGYTTGVIGSLLTSHWWDDENYQCTNIPNPNEYIKPGCLEMAHCWNNYGDLLCNSYLGESQKKRVMVTITVKGWRLVTKGIRVGKSLKRRSFVK